MADKDKYADEMMSDDELDKVVGGAGSNHLNKEAIEAEVVARGKRYDEIYKNAMESTIDVIKKIREQQKTPEQIS